MKAIRTTWILREHGLVLGLKSICSSIQTVYELNSHMSQGVKEAVSAGLGISNQSRWIVRKELEAGEITAIPLSPKLTEHDFWIIQNKDFSCSMAIQIFIL